MFGRLAVLVFVLSQAGYAAKFSVSSPSFADGKHLENRFVFNSFGCSGENKSPALKWANAPAGTKSFGITAYDPDAPTGSGWWHWTVANLPAETKELTEGAGSEGGKLPEGSVQGRTDFGRPGYGGACPPPGDKPHRYIFTVFALKVAKLDVNADASGAMYGYNLNANALGKASITALYGR